MRLTLTDAIHASLVQTVELAFIGPLLLVQAGAQGQQHLQFRAGIHDLGLCVAKHAS